MKTQQIRLTVCIGFSAENSYKLNLDNAEDRQGIEHVVFSAVEEARFAKDLDSITTIAQYVTVDTDCVDDVETDE